MNLLRILWHSAWIEHLVGAYVRALDQDDDESLLILRAIRRHSTMIRAIRAGLL